MARLHDATCQGKKVFTSWSRARRSAHRAASKHDKRLRPYTCPYCHKIHVGEGKPTQHRPRVTEREDETT